MILKTTIFIISILLQIYSYMKNRNHNKLLPFFILTYYTIKPIIVKYLTIMDVWFKIAIFIIIILELINIIREGKTIKYNKYLIYFLMLIVINGIYNTSVGHAINYLYIQGLINFLFIILVIFYIANTIKTELEFKKILLMTRYSGMIIFLYTLYDKFVLGLNRVGDVINPNYFSQMSLILLLFYFYSVKNKFSLKSITYYSMLLFTIISTGSSSGLLALVVIALSYFLFKLGSKKLIVFSNYIVWITVFFYMFAVILTSNYEIGLLEYFVKSEDTSRIILWQYTFESILLNPLMGELYNTFRAPWEYLILVTHNDLMQLMAELGVGSIILLFLMVKEQIKNIINYNIKDGFFLYSFIMITLSFSLSHNNLYNLMFWFALTLPSFLNLYEQEKNINNKK